MLRTATHFHQLDANETSIRDGCSGHEGGGRQDAMLESEQVEVMRRGAARQHCSMYPEVTLEAVPAS